MSVTKNCLRLLDESDGRVVCTRASALYQGGRCLHTVGRPDSRGARTSWAPAHQGLEGELGRRKVWAGGDA